MRAPLRLASSRFAFGEGRRASEENNPGFVEAVFFDRLDDGGFAASFGENTGDGFFVDQAEIGGREAAFFEQAISVQRRAVKMLRR